MALETEHRKRLAEVHSEVTKRLVFTMLFELHSKIYYTIVHVILLQNFKVEEESLERRLQQEHIVDWLVNSVQSSITPAQVWHCYPVSKTI